jgi:branched-subunit amino acid transport protein AzlD
MLITPLINSYKLGAINHFVPNLNDLIEPALLLILFIWIVGSVFIFNKKYTTSVIITLAAVTVLLFFFV